MATAVLLPPDYHRILSPTLRIPTDTQVPIPVGILACQRDPLLRSLVTSVVSASLSHPQSVSTKKSGKKSVIAPTIPSEPLLEVILHDTVIFPEGGGQPTDTGIITTGENGVVWEVVQAKRHGGHAVHYVRIQDGNVDNALSAFPPGASVTVALDKVGSDRRYDHMSMHTSQHLLSALLETRLGLPTLSWSLTTYPAPCYVEVPRGMSIDEVTTIQTEANKLVFEGRKVHVEVDEIDRDQEKAVPIHESGRAVGRGLPSDYTGGVKRVVVIDGIDRNPCCGTHLPSIHNLQLFLLPHTDALARSGTTSARLHFVSGPRLIAHLTSAHSLLSNTATILSCGAPLVPERVTQVLDERKKAEKRVDMNQGDDAGLFKKHVSRTDDTANALGLLSAISFAVADMEASKKQPYIVVLTSSPSSQTATSTTTVVVFGSDEKVVKEAGDGLKTKLGVKGGGKGIKWSGKFTGVWKKIDRELEDLLNKL